MNRLRTHIVRIIVLVLIWTGFSLYMVQSARAEYSSHAFARWLSTMARSSNTADLQKQLDDLRRSNDHLDKVIEKASRIVSRNNDEFSFPFAESTGAHKVYQLLLFEWNQVQTENTMASLPAQPTVKAPVPLKLDKSGLMNPVPVSSKKPFLPYQLVGNNLVAQHSVTSLTPMSSGIAIGAP